MNGGSQLEADSGLTPPEAAALIGTAEALLQCDSAFVDSNDGAPSEAQQLSDEQLASKIQSHRSVLAALEAAMERQDAATAHGAIPGAVQQPAASMRGGDGPTMHGEYEVGNVDDLDPREWQVPPHCIPIHANVTTYDWPQLYGHTQFDVIMMDPPWQLATANPTRGVSLGYSQLTDNDIANLPVPRLQSNGLLFIWVINAKYKWTLDLFEKWGYTCVPTCNSEISGASLAQGLVCSEIHLVGCLHESPIAPPLSTL